MAPTGFGMVAVTKTGLYTLSSGLEQRSCTQLPTSHLTTVPDHGLVATAEGRSLTLWKETGEAANPLKQGATICLDENPKSCVTALGAFDNKIVVALWNPEQPYAKGSGKTVKHGAFSIYDLDAGRESQRVSTVAQITAMCPLKETVEGAGVGFQGVVAGDDEGFVHPRDFRREARPIFRVCNREGGQGQTIVGIQRFEQRLVIRSIGLDHTFTCLDLRK